MPAAEPKILYSPRADATPESELNALSAIYQRAIERYDEGKEGGPATSRPDDGTKVKEDSANDKYKPAPQDP